MLKLSGFYCRKLLLNAACVLWVTLNIPVLHNNIQILRSTDA